MTIAATRPYVQMSYTGPGTYNFSFRCYDVNEIQVTVTVDSIDYTLQYGTHYYIVLDADYNGGKVYIQQPDWASSGTVTIRGDVPYAQQTDYVNNSPIDMEILERSFDKAVMMAQQLDSWATELDERVTALE